MQKVITPQELIAEILRTDSTGRPALIDVRSEGEFSQGSFPSFVNVPILSNTERHDVGICYKTHGNEKAVELGLKIFGETGVAKEEAWLKEVRSHQAPEAWMMCWRGGSRSQFSAKFLTQRGVTASIVRGGYKAVRNELRPRITQKHEHLWVLSGLTGSGKTELLQEIPSFAIDLEDLAKHRGSAFGHLPGRPQPTQADFENRMALEVVKHPRGFVVEDESVQIGAITLPPEFKQQMSEAPVIRLTSPMEARVQRIFQDYVIDPLTRGNSAGQVRDILQRDLTKLKSRLGAQLHDELSREIGTALSRPLDLESSPPLLSEHENWIQKLLQLYYDRLYLRSLERQQPQVAFEGPKKECLQWIQHRFASLKP